MPAHQIIQELFDRSRASNVEVTADRPNYYKSSFSVTDAQGKERRFFVQAKTPGTTHAYIDHHYDEETLADTWDFSFGTEDQGEDKEDIFGIQGNRLQFSVFPTVVEELKRFVARHKPLVVTMHAREKNRAALYKRMIDRIAGGLGYELAHTVPIGQQTLFVLERVV